MIAKILVPLDGSALAEQVLDLAVGVATAFDAEIIVLRVVETDGSGGYQDGTHWRFLHAEAQAYVNGVRQRLVERGVKAPAALVQEGNPAERILRCSKELGADLIVLGSHGHAHHRIFSLGTTIQQVVYAADVSVMIVPVHVLEERRADQPPLRRILVPVDGSQRAECALCCARTIASAVGATLHVLHVVPVPEMARRFPPTPRDEALRQELIDRNREAARDYLDSIEARLRSDGLQVQPHLLVSSHVSQTIQRIVGEQDIDLLIGSAHGHSGHGEWPYGGIAGSLIAHSEVPLLVFQDLAYEQTEPEPCRETDDKGLAERVR